VIANGQNQTFQRAFAGRDRAFLVAAEAMHKSIVGPLLDYHGEHYRALREVHGPLLKSIETITGKRAPFIQPNMTGPVRPPTAG
jgi:hypothetical protein